MLRLYKGLRRLCAVLIGLVLFFAGTVKLLDPVGAGLVAGEYLKFLHLGFLLGAAKALAVALSFLEAVFGAALVAGVWRKLTGFVSGILLCFFTILTFFLWLKNPPMDCGCFGEAIHLTHAQTLIKNVVLMVLWVIAFVPFKHLGKERRLGRVSFLIAVVSTALFTMYSLLSIPLVDFTDFAPGAEIYAETGLEEDDPQWDLSENLAVALPFSDAAGQYCDRLVASGPSLVVSVYDPETLDGAAWQRIASFLDRAESYGCTPLLLAASTPDRLEALVPGPVLLRSFYADRRTLMTLNRSNGGATFISDGQVTAKWPLRSLPDGDTLSGYINTNPTEAMMKFSSRGRTVFQAYLLYVTAVMLLL